MQPNPHECEQTGPRLRLFTGDDDAGEKYDGDPTPDSPVQTQEEQGDVGGDGPKKPKKRRRRYSDRIRPSGSAASAGQALAAPRDSAAG